MFRGLGKLAEAGNKFSRGIWIDVGAHLGETTFRFAEEHPDLLVYAFEPNVSIAVTRMGCLPNFIVFPMAVAAKDGTAKFYINSDDSTSSLLPLYKKEGFSWKGGEDLKTVSEVCVPTIRLDTFFRAAKIKKLAYLKIDAQGADLDILLSAGDRLRDIKEINIEVYLTPRPQYEGAGNSKLKVVDYLTVNGFELSETFSQTYGQEEVLIFINKKFSKK